MKKRITFNGCQGIRVSLLFLNINLFSFGNDRFKFNENRFPSHLIRSAIVLRSRRKLNVTHYALTFGRCRLWFEDKYCCIRPTRNPLEGLKDSLLKFSNDDSLCRYSHRCEK